MGEGGGQAAPTPNPLEEQSPLESGGGPGEEQADPFAGAQERASAAPQPAEGAASAPSGDPSGAVPDVSGAWSGTVTDETGAEGSLQVSLEQRGPTLTGNGAVVTDGAGGKSISPLEGSVDDTGALNLAYRHPEGLETVALRGTLDGESISGEATLSRAAETGQQQTHTATFFLTRAAAGG